MSDKLSESKMEAYDIVIVGGGISGLLACARLAKQTPQRSIAVVEQLPFLGGRLRSSNPEKSQWSCGLRQVSQGLLNFWSQVLLELDDNLDIHDFGIHEPNRLGILQAGKVREVPLTTAYSDDGARALGGGAAARDWTNVTKLKDLEAKESKALTQAFSHAFPGNRRSPSAVVLEHLSRSWGMPDLWSSQTQAVIDRANDSAAPHYVGNWDDAISQMLALIPTSQVQFKTDCEVLGAEYTADSWHLKTMQGPMTASTLVVACSPWEANMWLPKSYWPSHLSTLAQRGKPSSLVVLSEVITSESPDLPNTIIVPAENVQVQIDGKDLSFQATLDFEVTLQAPDAVKAVKRLKRASKKFHQMYPDITTVGGHIALIPVAWSNGNTPQDKRLFARLSNKEIQGKNLLFCGDAYGTASDTDQNILSSIATVYEAMLSI